MTEDDDVLSFELPRAAILKLGAKGVAQGGQPTAIAMSPSAQTAMARMGGLFVLYVTAAAVSICKEAKRQTISSQDVVNALKSLRYEDWVDPCNAHLESDRAHRPKHAPTLKKYRGVYQGSINAWYSQISIAGQPIHLGSFAAPEDAARAYDRAIWSKLGTAAAELLNFPEDFPESSKYLKKETNDDAEAPAPTD
ncbi:hypothetical protein CTAYLR_002134 [Chrysophaeum taylorii]|uniref:AP2/ERF domain-containing protein n=1 Tax=Chrysophaeum taylorii TaxID=2483200 RepID=A0AAD7UN68_9STRA|nr:hypothetical protein CTAYLR_002134 [Chrysophaeum taylorii]